MPIKKKKKEKEEFDASLMSGYLPGIQLLSTPKTVKSFIFLGPSNIKLIFNPHVHDYGIDHSHYDEGVLTRYDDFFDAFAYYGLAGVADPGNFLEAFAWRKGLGVPWLAGYALAGVRGFLLTGLILTLIDPAHQWSGGLDETRAYQQIAHKIKTDEAPSNLIWQNWSGVGTVV